MSDMLRRRYSRRSVLKSTGAAALGGSAAILVGCGGDEDGDGGAATATGTSGGGSGTATATATQAGTPRSGGTFRWRDEWGGNGDPVTLAPYAGTGGARTGETIRYSNPQLYTWDHNATPEDTVYGPPTPDFVAGPPEQPDGLTYVFKIPENAVWENKAPADGRRVTVEDVIWNIDQGMAQPGTAAKFGALESWEAVDDVTFTMTTSRPWGAFLAQMFTFTMHNPEFALTTAAEEDTLGCGMYRLLSLERGNQFVHERNPDYYGTAPYIDRLERVIIIDEAAAEASYRSGGIQGMSVSRKDVADSLVAAVPGSHVHAVPNHSNYWFGMDTRNPMFADVRVRQALSMALDREALLKIYGGGGVWGTPVGALAFATDDPRTEAFGPNRKYYEYNLDEAHKLMSAAGVERLGSMPLHFTQFLRGPSAVQEAELVASWLTKEFGANLALTEYQFADAYATLITTEATWEGLAICQHRAGPDPEDYLPQYWTPKGQGGLAPGIFDLLKAENPVTDLVDKFSVELDFDQRMEYSKEAVKVLAEHMYNIPFVLPDRYFVVAPQVHLDWLFSTSGGGSSWIKDAWIDEA